MPKWGRSWLIKRVHSLRKREKRIPDSVTEALEISREAVEAMQMLPPGTYEPSELHQLLDQFPRYMVNRAVWSMVSKDLAKFTDTYCLTILASDEMPLDAEEEGSNPELKHLCGSQGFGLNSHDVCPKCEFNRLTGLEVPEDIAAEAGWLRCFLNPSIFPPRIMSDLQEEFAELERAYGKKIP